MLISLLVGLFIGSAGQPPSSDGPQLSGGTDGQYRPLNMETTSRFECRGYDARLRMVQRHRSVRRQADAANARYVDLLEVRYRGRPAASTIYNRAREVLSSYAAIEGVRAECFQRSVFVTVTGIPRQAWQELVGGRRNLPLPRHSQTFRIGPRDQD